MPKTYSVRLPDGSTASRQSDRPYMFAVVCVRTTEQVCLRLDRYDAAITQKEAEVYDLGPRAADPADVLAFEEALAQHAWLHEQVEVTEPRVRGGEHETFKIERWLSQGYRASIGERESNTFGPGSALDIVQKASRKIASTANGKLKEARFQLDNLRAQRVAEASKPVGTREGGPEGSAWCESWSQSAVGASKLAEDKRRHCPGMLVYVTDEVSVHVPTPRRARKVQGAL